ncbi:MAG: hypothetical protein JOZ80_11695 [Acidobacteriaceae bacterium]|nr:hypothetical protein [Acidobacteriaceae bacterium]
MLRKFFRDIFPNIIPAKAHSVIDYAHVGGNLVAAAIMRKNNPAAANAAIGLAVAGLLNAVLTEYPFGLFRLYSFRAHGVVDYGIVAATEMIPKMFKFADEREARYFRVLAAGELLIVELSDYGDVSGSVRARNQHG